jgi:hypothetical protein
LGVPVGAKTADYNIDQITQNRLANSANTEKPTATQQKNQSFSED